jgi:hypothetical protein
VRTAEGQKAVELQDGTKEPFDHLLSTIPLPHLLRMTPDHPELAALADGDNGTSHLSNHPPPPSTLLAFALALTQTRRAPNWVKPTNPIPNPNLGASDHSKFKHQTVNLFGVGVWGIGVPDVLNGMHGLSNPNPNPNPNPSPYPYPCPCPYPYTRCALGLLPRGCLHLLPRNSPLELLTPPRRAALQAVVDARRVEPWPRLYNPNPNPNPTL